MSIWFRYGDDVWHSGIHTLCDGVDSEQAACGFTLERDCADFSHARPFEDVCSLCLSAIVGLRVFALFLSRVGDAVRRGLVLEALRGAVGPDVAALRGALARARPGTRLFVWPHAFRDPVDGDLADRQRLARGIIRWEHEDEASVPGTVIVGRINDRRPTTIVGEV